VCIGWVGVLRSVLIVLVWVGYVCVLEVVVVDCWDSGVGVLIGFLV